ncbi:MAG: Protein UmuD [Chlamydiia bacterium]|nr:Protein UmuD [Chlamydiia bacterium]MCH9615676.1 Protein UmuD [Chlamydiia bacterium]MCH9628921.1 Protein UmuD [Chlamydiia bacterium]
MTKNLKLSFFLTPVQAGFPSPADDYIEDSLDLNELLIKHPAATFFVRVEGESMIDAHIFPGDVLIVDRAITPTNKKIVVAILNGEFTLKRLQIEDGKITLLPENPSFPPIPITPEMDFEIWGVVSYVIHPAR